MNTIFALNEKVQVKKMTKISSTIELVDYEYTGRIVEELKDGKFKILNDALDVWVESVDNLFKIK